MMMCNQIVGAFFLLSLFALSQTQARISPGEGEVLKINGNSLNNGKTLSYLVEEAAYDQVTISLKNYGTYPDSSSSAPYIVPARSWLTSYTNYEKPKLTPPPPPGSYGPPVPRPHDCIINSSPMISSEYESSSDKIPVNTATMGRPLPPQYPSQNQDNMLVQRRI